MSVIKGCVVAAMALVAGAVAETARADEAYVCDAGRIVYVKPGELEIKKLQDPCIAKYFENTPTAKPVSPRPVAAAASQSSQTTPAGLTGPAAMIDVKPRVELPRTETIGDYRNVRIINAAPGAEVWFRPRH